MEMNTIAFTQEYDAYTPEEHSTWEFLNRRQDELLSGSIAEEYLQGCSKLNMDRQRIIVIDQVNRQLQAISGWSIVAVSGLISIKDFIFMLVNKKYPITVNMRTASEIDFTDHPDIFHDACGHLPLLTNEKFGRFLKAYSEIAIKYLNNERAVDLLGRLYWFTYEMGLIWQNGEYKAYGAAIITSAGEIENVRTSSIPKHPFDIDMIFDTPYSYDDLQTGYFVIGSFDDLFNSLETLEARLIERLSFPQQDLVLRNYPLNPHIGRKFNNVIGYLNDLQFKFPNAISFVAGQPDEEYFHVEDQVAKYNVYVDHVVQQTGNTRDNVLRKIGQYNKTKGIINDIVAEYLRKDENIKIRGEEILITAGAQEAFAIVVATVCDREKDIVLVENPSYIGLSAFAKVFDYNIAGVKADEEGIDLKELTRTIIHLDRAGKRVKLLYVIPDYQNPSGSSMPVGNRLKLLELAWKYNFLIIEDSVYNTFTYALHRKPTLKSLDRYNRVIYVGSFSKALFPGLRIGLIAADQKVENEMGENVGLIDEMVKVKAQISNNTATISQAIVGGILLSHHNSLKEWNKPKCESYKKKRDTIIACLHKYIKEYDNAWARGITWNEPDGGFFIRMILPFSIDMQDVFESAAAFEVMFFPMRHFYLDGGGEYEIRLTFSNLSPENIDLGTQRLAAYLKLRSSKTSRIKMTGAGVNSNY